MNDARRSDAQNRRLRALLEDISRSKPEGRTLTPETWKCLFMAGLDHDRRFADAQMIDGLEGRPPVFLGYNSSLLTVDECAELITFAQEYGDRHNVRWSGGDYDITKDPLMNAPPPPQPVRRASLYLDTRTRRDPLLVGK